MSGPRDGSEIAAFRKALRASGRRQWRGLDEFADGTALAELLGDEFASFREAAANTDRREFLRIMAASLALAGVAGCSPQRSESALPYVVQPEEIVPGRPAFYASAVTFEGYAQPVLAAMHRGRPTKLEGNPQHPAVLGRTDLFTQAAILDLYDPDRSPVPLNRGEPATLAGFERLLPGLRARWGATGGEGLALLVGPTTSPTLRRQLAALATRYPKARISTFAPVGSGTRHDATRLAFGRALDVLPRLDKARVVVSLDDDLLGSGPHQVWNVRDWASRRGEAVAPDERIRLHVAECTPTQTGAVALARLPAAASRMGVLATAIAAKLGLFGLAAPADLGEAEVAWVELSARDLKASAGHSLLTAGPTCSPEIGALALAVNDALGNTGVTFTLHEPVALAPDGSVGSLADLATDLRSGRTDTLVTLDANPLYAAPADLDLPGLLGRAQLVIHAGCHADETGSAADWHIPLPHPLESWSDARAIDGTLSLIQPLIEPLYASRSLHVLLHGLMSDEGASDLDLVRRTWRERFGSDEGWRRALHDGFVPDTQSPHLDLRAKAPPAPPPRSETPAGEHLEVVFRPDPTVWDGSRANNAWLQELAKPLTRTTWDNLVLVSPKLAEARGWANGERVRIESGGRSVEGPVWIMPGQAERTVTLTLGYGRRRGGRVCEGIGYDAYRVRSSASLWLATDPTLTRADGAVAVATLQQEQRMEGDDFVRVVSARDPQAARPTDAAQQSLYPDWPRGETAWGMVIDLDLCSGCNACVVACQAENNIPVVGRDQVARGRHMSWLRVDHYHAGEPEDPESFFQPVPCMHCEQAPCEMGCPVHATVHGPEGLNQMVYNRCIGTRTCSSYCPYKVRRFNWYDYTSAAPEALIAQRNPDVTVRGRGVMEKCTYCTQRIQAARAEADIANRPIRDGEVETACQGACPSRAITFGNIADGGSRVAKARASGRNYALLAHLGTRPRTTYLARMSDDEDAP